MNKIITKLIAVTYPTANIDHLMEVVNATPNPELATEILCGLYQEPQIPVKVKSLPLKGGMSEPRELTLKSFDKWQNAVNYSYLKENTLSGYFPKETDKSNITLENFHSLKESWKGGDAEQVSIRLNTGEFEECTDACSLEKWMSYEVISDTVVEENIFG